MAINKGRTQSDGTYLYTCRCNGRGCTDCYHLDTEKILIAMQQSKGRRYFALLKAFLSVQGKAIVDTFHRVKAEQGGTVTPVDIGYIVSLYRLNFKATVEWLEETNCLEAGAYRRITRKLTVAQIMAAARDKYAAQPEATTNQVDEYVKMIGENRADIEFHSDLGSLTDEELAIVSLANENNQQLLSKCRWGTIQKLIKQGYLVEFNELIQLPAGFKRESTNRI